MKVLQWYAYTPEVYRRNSGYGVGAKSKDHAVVEKDGYVLSFACGKELDRTAGIYEEFEHCTSPEDYQGYSWVGPTQLRKRFCLGCLKKACGIDLGRKASPGRSARETDHQRKKLYRAEWATDAVLGRGMSGMTLEDSQLYADALVDSEWWKRNFPEEPRLVTIPRGERRSLGGGWYRSRSALISLTSTDEYTLVHELAHHAHEAVEARDPDDTVYDLTSHGAVFAGILLMLVEHCMGARYAEVLGENLKRRVNVSDVPSPAGMALAACENPPPRGP